MEDEHRILLWEAIVKSVILTLFGCLGNYLRCPSFSSCHERKVSEAICLFAFHGLLLHCTAWLAVQAWEVWKCGQVHQLGFETPWAAVGSGVLCGFCCHLWTLGRPSSASPAISLANSGNTQQRASFHTRSLWEERHPRTRICSPTTY